MRRLLWLVAAAGAGALSALAMAPYFYWFVFLLTFPLLVLALGAWVSADLKWHKRLRRGFWPGLAFGFGYLALSLGWVGNALLVDADRYGWLLPFAQYGLPFGLALFFGIGAALAALVWSPGWGRPFALAAGLGLSEWLRGNILTGFPWNAPSQALADTPVLMQAFALVGPEAMTVVLIFAAAAPVMLVGASNNWWRVLAVAPTALIFGGLSLYGAVRLSEPVAVSDVTVRVVQPNIAQKDKWRPEERIRIVRTLIDLTAIESKGGPGLVIWPEAATPFFLQDDPAALAVIGSQLREGHVLATGTPRYERVGAGQQAHTYNGMLFVNSLGSIIGHYDKHHLVPFGEYVPLKDFAAKLGLQALVDGPGGFSEGPGPQTIALGGGLPSLSPLICYEVIFPAKVTKRDDRPSLLVNVTNDAWYGLSAGPPQHLAQARLRAVEQGVPLVRAANTGISAIIDPYGRVVNLLPLNRQGAIEEKMPQALKVTPFAMYGSIFIFGLLGLFSMIAIVFCFFGLQNRKQP